MSLGLGSCVLVLEHSGPRQGVELISCGTDVRLSGGVREMGVWVEESGPVEGPAGSGGGSEGK